MRTALLLSVFLVLSQAFFEDWMVQHNKQYSSPAEQARRKAIYHENVVKIAQLNVQNPRTRFGINKFADLTTEEFKSMYLSKTPMVRDETLPVAPLYTEEQLRAIPTTVDWRTKGAVTPVKNQGQCGSCWTFSTTGNIEGQWFLAGHELVGLSEQNLVDCDHDCVDGTCDAGCEGGLMTTAFGYVMKMGGIDTEASYPYLAFDSQCAFKSSNIGARISNFTSLSTNETQIAAYLAEHGPVSVAVDATVWQFYFGGVLYIDCGTTLDHGVLLVGYGTETDILDQPMPYWTIKNSWGADWGDSGYIYIERGVGECGVNQFACSSIV